jgi:hypothetical protein
MPDSWLSTLGNIFGVLGQTPTKTTLAPPLTSYPSQEDARQAMAVNYGYGTGAEPYIQAQRAQIYDRPQTGDLSAVMEAPSSNVDLTKFKNIDELNKIKTLYAQGALAANRSAIATLGFEPQASTLQTKMGKTNIAGITDPETGQMYVNVQEGREPSTIVHESIHRGLDKLRQASPEAADIMKKLPNQELIVRYLMAKTMGNPEQGTGETADMQRQSALDYFMHPIYGDPNRKNLEKLEDIAAFVHAQRRPRGPR